MSGVVGMVVSLLFSAFATSWVFRDRRLLARLRSLLPFRMLTFELLRDGSSCAASSARSEVDGFSVLEDRRDGIGIKR